MKQTILLIISVIIYSLPSDLQSQIRHEGGIITCPYSHESGDLRIPPPEDYWKFKDLSNSRIADGPKHAEFIVTYVGFEDFPEAQAAYQFALDIWSSLLYSDVPIYLRAGFGGLASGVLAQAGPDGFYSGFQGAENDTTFYIVALAEKMARKHLNDPGVFDISATFGNSFNWYFGTDGNVASDQYDFIGTVLHEVGHGLGMYANTDYDENLQLGYNDPGVYNNYIVNGSGVSIHDVENISNALGSYLRSNDLFINSPGAMQVNGGAPAEIYAPFTYNGGSSISHLGESFNNTENDCMTHSAGTGESVQNPGPIVLRFFQDMGWLGSTLLHDNKTVIEGLNEDVVFELDVLSDVGFEAGFDVPKFVYSQNQFETSTSVDMILTSESKYTATITNPGQSTSISYYFDGLKDSLRSYVLPSGTFKDDNLVNPFSAVIVSDETKALDYTLLSGGDFENGDEFTTINLGDGLTNLWERGTPSNVLSNASSGTNVWKTDLDANITKPSQDIISGILSPKFDLSDEVANYTLSFDLTMDSDHGALYASVVYTIDGGKNWVIVGNNQDGRGTIWFNSEIPGFPGGGFGWSLDNSGDTSPLSVSYNISNLASNDNVRFAIVAFLKSGLSQESYAIDGIMIDDFQLIKEAPKASFGNSTVSALTYPGEGVQFEFLSSGATAFVWDFGDGNTSTEENPVHAYEDGGEYVASLTITYEGGTNTTNSTVVITPLYSPSYSLTDGGDFETSSVDFYAINLSGTGWERGNSTVAGKEGTASGDFAWVTGVSEAQYVDQSEGFLYTPRFDFSKIGNYEISFMANYNTEEEWDGFIMEYTTDNAVTWSQLEPEVVLNGEWYDGIAVDNAEQGWPAIPLFSGTTNGEFVMKRRDLSSLSGTTSVGFRFHWKSDFAFTVVGIALDNFELKGPSGSASVDFSVDASSFCTGTTVTFESILSGEIETLTWDFGSNSDPQTASGIGPHAVTYTSEELVTNTVKLTAGSSTNEDVSEEKTEFITIVPEFVPTISGDLEAIPVVMEASEGDSYQWFLNGGLITDATSKTLEVTTKGAYSVEVAISGCAYISDEAIVSIVLTANYLDKSVSVYPNPSDGHFMLSFDQPEAHEYEISIFTMTGQQVFAEKYAQSQNVWNKKIDLSNLMPGTYFVRVSDENNVTTLKKLLIK